MKSVEGAAATLSIPPPPPFKPPSPPWSGAVSHPLQGAGARAASHVVFRFALYAPTVVETAGVRVCLHTYECVFVVSAQTIYRTAPHASFSFLSSLSLSLACSPFPPHPLHSFLPSCSHRLRCRRTVALSRIFHFRPVNGSLNYQRTKGGWVVGRGETVDSASAFPLSFPALPPRSRAPFLFLLFLFLRG